MTNNHLLILELLRTSKTPLTSGEVARKLGIDPSTALRGLKAIDQVYVAGYKTINNVQQIRIWTANQHKEKIRSIWQPVPKV